MLRTYRPLSADGSLVEDHPLQNRARSVLASTALVLSLMLIATSSVAAQGVATLRTPGPDAQATEAPTEEAAEGQEAILAFAQCMRDEGIDFPDPQFGVGGGFFGGRGDGDGDGPAFDFQGTEFRSALESCGSFLEALQPDLDPEQQAEQAEQGLAFAQCMRAEGIDFPDPDPSGNFGFRGRADAPFDFGSDDFQAAFETCQTNEGFGFGPGGGGPGGDSN